MESSDRKATLLSLTQTGSAVVLRLRSESGVESYRVSRAGYEALGSPAAGDRFDAARLDALSEQAAHYDALLRAERILAAGDNTRRGLLLKLLRRGVPRASAELAVRYLYAHGYIREAEQAYRAAVQCVRYKHWGRVRITEHLLAKGYARADIERAIDDACADGEIDFDAALRTLAEKKLGDDPSPADLRALAYRYGYR